MRGAIVLLAGLAFAAPATAAPPAVTASATPSTGVAPLRVTLSANGDAALYAWDLGDGTTAAGALVTHVYSAGRFTATVTATNAAGETSQAQVQVVVSRRTVSLAAPRTADYGGAATLSGVLRPAARGARVQIYRANTYVTSARVGASGRFRARILVRSPGPYHVRFGGARSPARMVVLRPELQASLPAVAAVGGALTLRPRLVPARAGAVRVRVFRDGRLVRSRAGRIPTARPGSIRVELTSAPRPGYTPVRRTLSGAGRPALARPRVARPERARARAPARTSSTTRSAASTASTARTRSRQCSPSRR